MNSVINSRGTVLIVNDDPAVLLLIQNILATAGYRVLHATTSPDALRLAAQRHIHIDVALLDVQHRELADELRALRTQVRVLWMCGFVDDDFVRIKMLHGCEGQDIVQAVRHAVEADVKVQRAFAAGAAPHWE